MISFTDNLVYTIEDFVNDDKSILDVIRAPLYKASDSLLTYKQINDLDESGLIHSSDRRQNKWRRFSLYDLFYIELAFSARKRIDDTNALAAFKEIFYTKKVKQDDLDFHLYLGEYTFLATLLDIIIPLFIFTNGEIVLTDILNSSTLIGNGSGSTDGVLLMIQTFSKSSLEKYSELFANFNIEKYKYQYQENERPSVVTYEESTILDLVRSNKYSKIIISKGKNGKLTVKGESSTDGRKINPEDILELITRKKFGSVTVSKKAGNIINLTVTDVGKL